MIHLSHHFAAAKSEMRPLVRWSTALLLAGLCSAAPAAVYKCVGADGKVAFSDQACPMAQGGSAIKPTPQTATCVEPIGRAACIKLRDRIADLLEKGTSTMPETEVRALVARAEAKCADVARQETRQLDAKVDSANAPLRQKQDAARCKIMQSELEAQQLEQQVLTRQGVALTHSQIQQRAAFAATLAKECGH